MPKISACIISFNEEHNIEDCLKSLEGIAEEIIIVDSLSTDRTVEIASRYTDRIYHQKFLGHVEQYSLAVSKAENDWVLILDCDERLSPELRSSILAIKELLDEQQYFYRVSRKSFYIYRWLDHCWYPDKKVRLYNKKRAQWGGINPHASVQVEEGRVTDLRGDLLHYTCNSISEHLQTIDKFSDISAREMIDRGKHVSLYDPLTHGIGAFIRLYVFKRGFLDGMAGFIVSVLSSMGTFVKYSKVLVHQRKPGRDRL